MLDGDLIVTQLSDDESDVEETPGGDATVDDGLPTSPTSPVLSTKTSRSSRKRVVTPSSTIDHANKQKRSKKGNNTGGSSSGRSTAVSSVDSSVASTLNINAPTSRGKHRSSYFQCVDRATRPTVARNSN